MDFDWKYLSGAVAVILSSVFGSLATLGVVAKETGILTPAIGTVVSVVVGYYTSPRINLQIYDFEVFGYEYGNFRGFQVRAHIRNRGNRIATSFGFTSKITKDGTPVKISQLALNYQDGQPRVVNRADFLMEPLPGMPYGLRAELRLGDKIELVFPCVTIEAHQGTVVLVEYRPGNYEFSIEATCEDPLNKTVHLKTKKVKRTLSLEDWSRYWLNVNP